MSSSVNIGLRGGLAGLMLVTGVCVLPTEGARQIFSGVRSADVALLSGQQDDSVVNLVLSGSGYPTPPSGYLDAAYDRYLEPMGYAGQVIGVSTPQLYTYPIESMDIGAKLVVQQFNQVMANDPNATVNIFGYSQSASMMVGVMNYLHEQGVSPDNVHFTMVGNAATPNGGMLNMLNMTPFKQLMEFVGQNEVGTLLQGDLYHGDVYAIEYDGFADFPKYPLNLLSSMNAVMGLATQHLSYLGLSQEQIDSAITLPVEGDSMIDYHMIPSELLPILAPLLLLPAVGQPLYDLLAPDMRILVNLGYGNMDHGWNDGPVNVVQTADITHILPPNIDMSDLFTALGNGLNEGFKAFSNDLADVASLQPTAFASMSNELLKPLVNFGQALGALQPGDGNPLLIDFLTNNLIQLRDNQEQFLAEYSSTHIPDIISYLFGTPYGYLLLADAPLPDFDFGFN